MGVIAKRPIANAAWRTGERPANAYHHAYWDRLAAARLRVPAPAPAAVHRGRAAVHRLAPRRHTRSSWGPRKPGRWRENAALLAPGALPAADMDAIRHRWHQTADETWVGQR